MENHHMDYVNQRSKRAMFKSKLLNYQMVVTIYSGSEGFMNHLLWEINRVSMEYL
jgi:hypothetical protein